jgi:hypothetical protein
MFAPGVLTMKKIVLTFGCLSGAFSAAMMFAAVPLINRVGFDHGATIGYTAIVLSLLFVFFGVRAYRDQLGDAPLSFGRAFGVGILITVISCVFYVVAWEIIYFNFMPNFIDDYTAFTLDKLRASGATEAAIEASRQEFAQFKELYSSLPINIAFTFLEPLPVGLLITAISALILRRRGPRTNHAHAVQFTKSS